MVEFGNQLKQFLEESGVSVNRFSKMIDMDRSYLYRIFNGTKTVPEEKLYTILKSEIFSQEQRNALRNSYYAQRHGQGQYERIRTVLRNLEKACSESAGDPLLFDPEHASPLEHPACFSDATSLCTEIGNQLVLSCRGQDDFLYTNYTCEQVEVDQVVYSILRAAPEKVRFHRYMYFSPSGDSVHNINAIFSSFKFLIMGYNVSVRYQNRDSQSRQLELFPYFIYCKRGLMLFDTAAENGLWIPDAILSTAIREKIIQMESSFQPLALMPRDIFELKDFVGNFSQLEYSVGNISYYPCLGPYMTEEILFELANPSLSNIPYLIASTMNHYATMKEVYSTFTLEGLREFIETGVVLDFPRNIIQGPLSPSQRIIVLKKILDKFRRNPTSVQLLDTTKIHFPKGYNIEFYDRNQHKAALAATRDREDGNGFLYDIIIPIEDPVLANDIILFKDFLVYNRFVYEEHYTEHLLEDLMTLAKTFI